MTEQEWLNANDPEPMLTLLMAKQYDRKFRLFGVACCQKIWERITNPISRFAVETAERYADGLVAAATLEQVRARHRACDLHRSQRNVANAILAVCLVKTTHAYTNLESAMEAAKYSAKASTDKEDGGKRKKDASWLPLWTAARTQQVLLLRDIFGNPFRPVSFEPSWRSSTVFTLATGIYDEKAFDRFPILADALQDAGCDSEELLNHFRQPGAHCRGCWALDLVLGKE